MRKLTATICLLVFFAAAAAWADWIDEDGHKMHYPQHPDLDGWDIDMTQFVLADDWRCSQTGFVDDIHFWASVEYGEQPQIASINVSIHDNITAQENPYGDYSMPGDLLRAWTFNNFAMRPVVNDLWQGWDDPRSSMTAPVCRDQDHRNFWQINITDISQQVSNPLKQEIGKIYWLDLQITALVADHLIGWKTTDEPWNDVAVYMNPGGAGAAPWIPVKVCQDDMETDFAFVITPEPATIAILGIGSMLLFSRRRRR